MPPPEPPPPGVFESLRRLGDAGLALLQNRLRLFGVELQEQKTRLVRICVLVSVTLFLGTMALVVVTVTIVVMAGEKARGPVLIGLSLLYVLAATLAFLALRKDLRSAPPPFSDSLSELQKDRDWLNPGK
jgi:uncharacterized membrane protein YqjE